MKLTLNLLVLALFTLLFVSCSDSPVTSGINPREVYDYTVMDVLSIDSVNKISAADENTLYTIKSFTNKVYKISNGTASPFDLQEPEFRAMDVHALSSNYIVFQGLHSSGDERIKIYDNGVFRSYTSLYHITYGGMSVLGKDHFISHATTSNLCFSMFKDGVFSLYTFPDSARLSFAKIINNEVHVFAINTLTYNSYYNYKISGNELVRVNSFPAGNLIFNLEKDIVGVTNDPYQHSFSYFTGVNWNLIGMYTTYEVPEFSYRIVGSSKDYFVNLAIYADSANTPYYLPTVWNGINFEKQKNFPKENFKPSFTSSTLYSEYNNNAFFIYRQNTGSAKILKAKLRTQ